MTSDTVLVTTATGKTGKRVAHLLEAAGVSARRGSRRAAVPFDWDDQGTWDGALDGVYAAYVAPAEGNLAVPAFIAEAERNGIEQVVLLSARGVATPGYYDNQVVLAAQHLAAEEAVRTSGMRWTILRPGWFAQNFDEGAFAPAVRAGELALPIAAGAAAFTDAQDIAAVAVAALADPGMLHGTQLELTGPAPVTLPAAVAMIATASGTSLQYRAISEKAYRAALLRDGSSQHDTDVATAALSPIRSEREGVVTSAVYDVLGRPPTSCETYVARAFGRDPSIRREGSHDNA